MKTVAVIGLGNRGAMYARRINAQGGKVVAVCDVNESVLNHVGNKLGVPQDMRFTSADEMFSKGKLADAIVVATQDRDHYGHAKSALLAGYHVLCEKPVSPIKEECIELVNLAKEKGLYMVVCHVLRYAGFYDTIKKVIDSGEIGEITNIQQTENVGYWHFSHSYVRGNWRREDETTPSILAKCCHDLDMLYYYTGKKCKSVTSIGSRRIFLAENAPEGAPKRCMDGCPHKKTCPYYAPRFYYQFTLRSIPIYINRASLVTRMGNPTRADVKKAIKETSPYGRCVYHCDNDVMENQTVLCKFDGDVNATLTMNCSSRGCFRRVHITGTKGELFGKDISGKFRLNVWGKRPRTVKANVGQGHLGGDSGIIHDFLELLETGKANPRVSFMSETLMSHLMGFGAEESRKNGGKTIYLED
ncbi:MAG: Gfo/Idh/MocA family oxidoreductase [Clostridia bacterium]|nr:Gfo/Idh/MocA family oxidoreductase [Clostridia bacterium]